MLLLIKYRGKLNKFSSCNRKSICLPSNFKIKNNFSTTGFYRLKVTFLFQYFDIAIVKAHKEEIERQEQIIKRQK